MMKKMYTIGCFVGKCTTKFICLGIFACLFFIQDGYTQPWSYNFGTGTGTHPTNSTSTSFLTSLPSGGGTYRVRTGTGGGTIVLDNPGTSLGTGSELVINSATGTSTNKFGVYTWNSSSDYMYLKCKIRTTSSGNGNINLSVGTSAIGSDNQGFTSQYNASLASMRINYSGGAISSVQRRTSGSDNTISSSGLSKDTDQEILLFLNNASSSTTYYYNNTTYTLNAQQWDLWVDGTKVSPANGWVKAGTLAAGTNLDGFAFFAESSASNAAVIYLDDLEYSNALPAAPVNSSASNIIRNASFTEPTNIAYASTQENTNLTTSNSVEVAQFSIQDGGGSADADALSTILNAISFNVTNSGLLRRIALYDGTTELGEVATSSTISFSGLTLTAADGGSKTFSLRVSFASSVTDNQQFSFAVSSATASGSGSGFAAANAGGAASSITGDANRIEVTATKLVFTQQPTTTSINAAMNPAVTVVVRDALENVDLDYTSAVSITSTGTLTGSPVSATPNNLGVATFSTLTHTAEGTGLTLTASASGLTNAISNTFDITNPQPEINVKENTTSYASGATYTFANQISGTSSSAITFTIENTGTANLNISGTPKVNISGANAAEFTINETSTAATVAASGTTTFTITFSPTNAGSKAAQITIASNDTDEGSYVINLAGTATVNAASDIVEKSGYTYPTNIPYASHQATNIAADANSVEIAQFTLRDGGASADADNLGTTLNQIVFNIANHANIRRIALYDGTTEIGTEQVGAATVTFSGLSLAAADGGTKDFSVRVSFNNTTSTITDNQQIQLTIAATTTAASSGSSFAATNAGGATTSTAGDNNRIEVTADRLAFVQNVSNATTNVAMTPAPTVSANDVNGIRDLDYSINGIAITSSGTLTGSPVSVTPNQGFATFSTLTHTVAGTGLTLTAASTGLTSATSNTFTVIEGPCHTETFTNIGSSASYGSRTWTGEGGTWTATDAREDQTITGKAITIRNGVLTSPQFTDGIGSLTVTVKLQFTETTGNLVFAVNGNTIGTILFSETNGATPVTKTFSGINIAGNVVITATSTVARYTIDDLNWTCYTNPPCAAPTADATNLNLTPISPTQINGSFTAASPAPTGYLVVRYSNDATSVSLPTNATTYTVGNTIGSSGVNQGTVVAVGTSTNFSATSLSASTTYKFYIYPYNNTNCIDGPVYKTNTPLNNTATTQSPAPEINVTGNAVTIVDGDNTPTTADHTDFGSVGLGSSFTRTFTIQNTGTATLNISGSTPFVAISGTNAADFAVTTPPSNTIAAGGSTTFVVTFTPTVLGARNATITINNDDADEAVYNFDIAGTATTSALSDIVSAYTASDYNQNIDYTLNQNATISSTANSIRVFRFDIRDGGGTVDADNLPTILSNITFNVTNIANIRTAALFDGNTLINASPTINAGAGTIGFSGLSYSTADGATNTLSLRITFATNVVDKSQLQFFIASANVGAAGSNTSSLFASFSTVQSLITNNINRVVVTADRLRFVTQPTGSTAGVNLTAFTIAAVDALGSIDVDATNAVTLTTTGTGMSSGSPYTLVDGTLSISNVQFSSGNTGITLTITTTGLSFDNDDVSNTFNIETVAVNSYRTTSGGTWAAATWERFVSGAWTTVSAPAASVTDEVYIRNEITSGSFTPAKVIVQSGGVLTVSGSSTISTSLLVQTGGTLQVEAALNLNGSTFTIDSAGVVNVNSTSISGTSSIWSGTENFNKNSTVNIQNWNYGAGSGANRLIQNPSIISANANGYFFGNLTISGSPSQIFVMVNGSQTINLAEGNFTVATTGGSNVAFTNAAANVTIGGNLIVTANTFSFAASTSGNSVSTVLGNILATGGTVNLNQGSSASASSTIQLKGNLNIANGAALSSSDEGCAIFFSGTTTQTLSIAGTLNTNVAFDIDNGATVQLINQNLSLANASNSFDVLTGGTLDFNGFDITGLGAFTTASGATLKITSANGVNATGNNTGNVQSTGTRTFSQSGNFHYVGNASPQSTGTAMTSGSTAKQILIDKTNATDIVNLTQSTGTSSLLQINNGILVETASANITGSGALTMNGGTYRTAVLSTTLPQLTGAYTFSSSSTLQLNGAGAQVLRGGRDYTNLTFSNSGTKTLTSAISNINGTVTIQDAAIVNTENNTFGGATTNLTMTGTARLINAGTTTRPTISGTYNLASTTTIEFNNSLTTTQPIRASGVTYANIDVSGTSVGITTSTASITMQSGTTFTVKNGATFKNKNINGFSGGANTAIGNTNNPNIVLETGSTVEYNGVAADNPSTAAQTITPINYSNLLISGDRGNATVTLPSSTIGIGNIFSTTATNVNYSTASNTINFNGSVDQTIPVFPYHHLATGGTGTKSIADNLTLNGGLSVGENTSLQASNYIITPAAANSVTITGTFITSNVNGFSGAANTAINSLNNPGFNLTNGTIVYNAAVEQNVTPRNDYHHVTIRNNSTKLLLGNAVFNGSLNLEDGVFNISGQTVTFQNGNTPLLRTNGTITTNGLTNLVFGTMGNTGGNAFTIPNNLFTNATPTLANFTINRSNSLTLNNQFFNLIRKLDLQSGNLILPNNYIFTLKSTSILNTALVAPVGGTIAYGTGAAFMVERFIPKDITKNSGNGIRAFRDISPGLMPDADIFSTWQEGGINNNGFGTQITGKVGTPGTVDAITGLDLTTSGNPSLYSFNVSLSNGVPSWDNGFTATKNVFASPFKGYRISIRGNRQNNLGINGIGLNNEVVLRSRGKLVTGTVRFTKDGVTATNDMSNTAVRLASSTTTSFTMVGNPYVSPLDFAKVMNNSVNSGIQKSCWVFDPNIGTAGAYVTYNSVVESNSNDSSQVNKYIQPGQAFFIRNNGTTSPVLEIREEDKAVDSVDNLRGVFSEGTVQPLHKIKFTLLKNVSNVFANMDGALLCFKNGFTNARGVEDALKFENTGENIALANNGNYSIEGKAIPTVSDSTVVRIWKMESAAAYQLKIDLTGVSINGLQPILKDRFTKTQTVLPINTVYNYSFTTSADTNSFNNRFTIVYTNTTPLPVAFISLKASQLNANNIIDWKVTESNIQHYTVEYTPQLSSAFSSIATINSNGSGTYQYTHVGATNNGGYYRIKATDYAGAIKYSSVVAIAFQGNNATIQVYPNPILLSNGLKLAFNAITTDNYTVQLVDNAGKLVYQTNVQHQTSQAIYTLPLPSSISAGNYQLKVIGNQIQHQQAIIIHP